MSHVFQTQAAQNDLVFIWVYTYRQWGEQQADRYLNDIEAACSFLVENAQICRLRIELTPPVRIYHVKHHLIIYIEVAEGIRIIRVLHENMDYQSHLDEESA